MISSITKVEAARNQMETAIRLFLTDGDPVSIHTLTNAARGILQDLGSQRGVRGLMEEAIANVDPHLQKVVREVVARPRNFFKHADRDPDGTLVFSADVNIANILDAVTLYQELTGETPSVCLAFLAWFFVRHKERLYEAFDGNEGAQLALDAVKDLDPEDKAAFLEWAK